MQKYLSVLERLAASHEPQPEGSLHPHDPTERADLFRSFDGGSTELEVLEFVRACVRINKPQAALETGTAFGFGTVAIADGLRANGFGTLETVELEAANVARAEHLLKAFAPELRPFVRFNRADSLEFLSGYTGPPFGFCFFDSVLELRHKEYELCRDRGLLQPGCLCVFHDTSKLRERYLHYCPEMVATLDNELSRQEGFTSPLSRGFTLIRYTGELCFGARGRLQAGETGCKTLDA